jgi:hypothetical protein
MIVLSAGMPRAGSVWHYSIIHDLMQTAGSMEAGEVRVKYRLQSILTKTNCNIGVLSARRLGLVMIPALMGKTFVIKAHARPTNTSGLLQRLGLLRITYIYRDPRDAMLSAFEAGKDALRDGRINAFSHLTDFDKSLNFIMDYVHIWEKWTKEKDVLISRYEDLLTDYDREITRLVGFLKLNGNSPEVQKVIERYRPGAAETREGLHFHMGEIGRFREAFSAPEQAVLREALTPYLPRMGYEA